MRIRACLSILLLLSFFSEQSYCQVKSILDEVNSSKPGEGKIKIIQDKSIETVLEKHQWEQSKQSNIDGFRIRIFSDSGPDARNEFEQTKARFVSLFDDIKVHESYIEPNYKLYVGDFRTKSEALKMLALIERQFPDAFMVPSKINPPNLKSE